MLKIRKKRKGFTLLELVVATASISIITSAVIVAINPQKSLSDAKNAARLHDLKEIESAMLQVLIDARNLPEIPYGKQQARDVCRANVTGENCTLTDQGVDLSILAPTYLVDIPVDPDAENPRITEYRVYRDGAFYKACSPILDPDCGPTIVIDPLCGDGAIDTGEECDDGQYNGELCYAPAGQSCTYCSHLCHFITVDSAVCGNGEVEGSEECDDGARNGEICETVQGGTCSYCSNECDVITVGDDGDSGGGDTGGGNCAPSDCTGDPPMAASYPCDDGSFAGPTCSLISGQCQWTIRSCPENDQYSCTPMTYAQQRVLALWLDTSSPELLLIADGKQTIADGDPVMLWNDRYTSRNDVLQGNVDRRPAYDEANDAVRFDGTNDLLQHFGNVTDFEGTTFVVFRSETNDAEPRVLLSVDDRTAGYGSFVSLRSGIRGLERGMVIGHNTSAGYYGLNTCKNIEGGYLTWEYGQSWQGNDEFRIWHNGKEQVYTTLQGAAYGTLAAPRTLNVGGLSQDLANKFPDLLPWNGDIKEVIVFREKLKNSERQCMDHYLQTKWGITAGTDAGSNEDCTTICCIPGKCPCGNGELDPGEECDDGNFANFDGCNGWCELEGSSSSSTNMSSSQPYDEFCGNGSIDLLEQCDDGNTIDGDGCGASCLIESVLSSSSSSSTQSLSSAGDSSSTQSSYAASTSSSSEDLIEGGPPLQAPSSSQSSTILGSSSMSAPGFPLGP